MRITLFLLVLLAGCGEKQIVKSNPPPTPVPKVISVPYKVYVPVPGEYLELCKWRATAPPSLAFEVARERKLCLQKYEAQLKRIRKIREKPVEETTP